MIEKVVMDVLKDLENEGQYGWEIYNWSENSGNGDLIDLKYGFKSYKDAELSGENELSKYSKRKVLK